MKSILDKMGITPNAMQQDAMHALLRSDKDVVVLSPTGSGKTLAYLLPLTQLVDAGDDMPQAIVVTPGRELALQSATVLKDMGSGLRAMACYGGRMTMDEHRVMRQVRPQIISVHQDVSTIIWIKETFLPSMSSISLLMSLINV